MALRWEGYGESEGCLGVPSLMARVEDYLGRPAFDPTSAQVVSVSVDTPAGNRFRAVVRVLDAAGKVLGERELSANGATCSALDEPLVLAVALLVDAELGVAPEQAAPPPPAPPPELVGPEPSPTAPPARQGEEEHRPPEPWRLFVDLTLLGADGLLPSLAAGAELGVELDPPWLFPLRLRAAGFLPQQTELEPTGKIDFMLGLVGAAACPLSLRPGAFGVEACVGADLLVQRAVSAELLAARKRTEWFWQGSLALRLLAELSGPWYGLLGTTVGVPVDPPRFVYRRSGNRVPVFQMADVSLTAGLGIGVRLVP